MLDITQEKIFQFFLFDRKYHISFNRKYVKNKMKRIQIFYQAICKM